MMHSASLQSLTTAEPTSLFQRPVSENLRSVFVAQNSAGPLCRLRFGAQLILSQVSALVGLHSAMFQTFMTCDTSRSQTPPA